MTEEGWRKKLGYKGEAPTAEAALRELYKQKRAIEELVTEWPSDEMFREATLVACLNKIEEVESFIGDAKKCDPRIYCDSHDQWGHFCD